MNNYSNSKFHAIPRLSQILFELDNFTIRTFELFPIVKCDIINFERPNFFVTQALS